MSGVAAIVSARPETLAEGQAALTYLQHFAEYTKLEWSGPGVWLGACGPPGDRGLAATATGSETSGDYGAAGAAAARASALSPVACAICGEVVNGAALRRELGLGEVGDDAELLLAAYLRWGDGLLARLEGVFAFILHDTRLRRTLAASDPCAVTALHVIDLEGDVLIASEAKAFFADRRFAPRLDEQACAELLTLGYTVGGRSAFAGVRSLTPGTHLDVRDGRLAVRTHWDAASEVGPARRGRVYDESLASTMRQLGGEAFAGGNVVLPLTGGLDSRLLAAVVPPAADPLCVTFGDGNDADSLRAGELAGALGLRHTIAQLMPAYLARHAVATVWLTEGALNPVANISGCLMAQFSDHRAFVSGIGGGLGRRYLRTTTYMPDRDLITARGAAFERRFSRMVPRQHLSAERLETLLGRGQAAAFMAAAETALAAAIADSGDGAAVDRIDVFAVRERAATSQQSTLSAAAFWVGVRAPYLTRRWIAALLAGSWEERIDDLARLRLIRRLDRRAAAVPWCLTHLPLRTSERVLMSLRGVARFRPARADPGDARTAGGAGAEGLVSWLKPKVYRRGEQSSEWLRGPSRAYLESVLLNDRLKDRGLLRARGVERLVAEHLSGAADHALALGQLVNLELWLRLFVDERPAPCVVAPARDVPVDVFTPAFAEIP